ncbi:MAG TPA: hypothetical protein PL072_08240 [Phycisphaerales bacterium]|nr:hypothetical protein [Phycisphaerales bacterium]
MSVSQLARIVLHASALVLATCAGLAAGCAADSGTATGDQTSTASAQITLNDKRASPGERANAVRAVWAAAQGGDEQALADAREEMKKMIWRGGAPQAAREAALECLLSDARPDALADTANMLRLRLPTEPNFGVLRYSCEQIAARAGDPVWRKTTTGLVRSWSRKLPSPADDQRPENAALRALYPDQSVQDTVFQVFVDPVTFGARPDSDDKNAAAPLPDSARKIRQSAWDLLGRIDPRGERRNELLTGDAAARSDDPMLSTLAACARELRVVPLTGSELQWATSLRTSSDKSDQAWWSEVSSLAASLSPEQAQGLQLRHLEPLRWASRHQAGWLSADRHALRDELAGRLEGRRTHRVGQSEGVDFDINRNRLKDWEPHLVWGDLLTILVLDEAVHDSATVTEWFAQADRDRADTSTEWGGCLFDAAQRPGGEARAGFVPVGYAARPAQRVNDRTFVASDDMFTFGGRSLAHYHFHVQTHNNEAYAGPGNGDRDYADLHNRNCLVLTSVRSGVLNVDYYQRGVDGVHPQIDLGDIDAPNK